MNPLLTAEQLSELIPYKAWTILKYKRDGIITAEIDLPHKVRFDAKKVRKQLIAHSEKKAREKYNGMIPTL